MQQIGLESVLVDKGLEAGLAKIDEAAGKTSRGIGNLADIINTG